MKKVLVLILALVMIMSLTACGGSGEKIEITMDNWQDYLELTSEVGFKKDANGAIEEVLGTVVLKVKDGYTVTEDNGTDITFEYGYDYVVRKVNSFDIETGEIEVGDVESSLYTDAVVEGKLTSNKFENMGGSSLVVKNGADLIDIYWYDNVSLVSIQGTLVLE